jgi:hypothetical protein
MTLSELLEGLKQIDPEEWEIIMHGIPLTPMSQYFTFDHGETTAHRYHSTYLPFSQMGRDVALIWLQGCLQRACEMREWDLRQDQWVIKMDGQNVVYHYATIEKGIAETGEPCEYEGRGKSQAEALLAAYVAAVKGESGLWLDRMRSARMS